MGTAPRIGFLRVATGACEKGAVPLLNTNDGANDMAQPAKELVSQNNAIVGTMDPEQLIAKAIEHNVSVDVLSQLLTMRASLRAERAREAYFAALAQFQSSCPVINKQKQVRGKDGGVRYSYAPLDDIVQQAGPHLKANDFSYSFKTEKVEDGVLVSCETRHIAGHVETSTVSVPIEKEAFMNDAQKTGSALMYGKRYAFCNAFGILTGDQDDDGKSMGNGISPTDMYRSFQRTMQAAFENHEAIVSIKEACQTGYFDHGAATWFELDDEVKKALWVAQSKGGIFTPAEREIIHSKKWADAYRNKNQPQPDSSQP